MGKDWTVEQNTGQVAEISRGAERKEIPRPRTIAADAFLEMLKPGSQVDDGTIRIILTFR
jgi:hypothetical protein